MTKIILDTDIDTDCDDVGALAELHALADRGEADIAAVVCNIPNPSCARCVQAINEWCSRPDIPVGLVNVSDWETNDRYQPYRASRAGNVEHRGEPLYVDQVADAWQERLASQTVHDAVQLYRRVLAEAEDSSVVICAIGLLTALDQLLASEADDISALPGPELVSQKVIKLVTMAIGSFPEGEDCWNWIKDATAAERVLRDWPVTVAVSEPGETITTGARLAESPVNNPIRRAYEIWHGGDAANRSSWDQVAVLYAVRGVGDCFREVHGHRVEYSAPTGKNAWHPNPTGRQDIFLDLTVSDEAMASRIEDLMVQAAWGKQ
ncbi:MAG: nucleoside hydrolase [Planctomycetota bacterium]|nr:nucleoside hydrolase [Planctomycetota bacterium]